MRRQATAAMQARAPATSARRKAVQGVAMASVPRAAAGISQSKPRPVAPVASIAMSAQADETLMGIAPATLMMRLKVAAPVQRAVLAGSQSVPFATGLAASLG